MCICIYQKNFCHQETKNFPSILFQYEPNKTGYGLIAHLWLTQKKKYVIVKEVMTHKELLKPQKLNPTRDEMDNRIALYYDTFIIDYPE